MTFTEDYTTILQNGTWTLHGTCPLIIEEWEVEEPPDEGIRLTDDDVDLEEGTAADGSAIYERQDGLIQFWTTNKSKRANIYQDIKDIVKDSGDHGLIVSSKPISFLDKYGYQLTVRRLKNVE